jgi:hypothetical protein
MKTFFIITHKIQEIQHNLKVINHDLIYSLKLKLKIDYNQTIFNLNQTIFNLQFHLCFNQINFKLKRGKWRCIRHNGGEEGIRESETASKERWVGDTAVERRRRDGYTVCFSGEEEYWKEEGDEGCIVKRGVTLFSIKFSFFDLNHRLVILPCVTYLSRNWRNWSVWDWSRSELLSKLVYVDLDWCSYFINKWTVWLVRTPSPTINNSFDNFTILKIGKW